MPNVSSGVFPCYENQFKVGEAGESTPTTAIADMESYSISINNNIQDWTAFGEDGWKKRLMTGKDVVITVKGKRNIGDTGNDMVANVAFKNGTEAQLNFLWNFPDGATLLFKNAVINVTAINTGDSTNVAPLEFEVQSNGKPVYTPAA